MRIRHGPATVRASKAADMVTGRRNPGRRSLGKEPKSGNLLISQCGVFYPRGYGRGIVFDHLLH